MFYNMKSFEWMEN